MKRIAELVSRIDEELADAKAYAEKYVDCKSRGNTARSTKFKEMATDELKHSMYLHEMAVADIEEASKTASPTAEMQKMWDYQHLNYIDTTATIKNILAM